MNKRTYATLDGKIIVRRASKRAAENKNIKEYNERQFALMACEYAMKGEYEKAIHAIRDADGGSWPIETRIIFSKGKRIQETLKKFENWNGDKEEALHLVATAGKNMLEAGSIFATIKRYCTNTEYLAELEKVVEKIRHDAKQILLDQKMIDAVRG